MSSQKDITVADDFETDVRSSPLGVVHCNLVFTACFLTTRQRSQHGLALLWNSVLCYTFCPLCESTNVLWGCRSGWTSTRRTSCSA